jgi:hypothetical protein
LPLENLGFWDLWQGHENNRYVPNINTKINNQGRIAKRTYIVLLKQPFYEIVRQWSQAKIALSQPIMPFPKVVDWYQQGLYLSEIWTSKTNGENLADLAVHAAIGCFGMLPNIDS